MNEPWSKRHKREFKGCKFSLSNSFAEPLSMPELEKKVRDSGDTDNLIGLYHNHPLEYVPNGGSIDLRQDIARVIYDGKIPAENILVFPGGQVAIQTAALAFASGGHSIVFTPGYQSTVESPHWAVGNQGVTKLERRPENDWQVDPQKLREAIQPNTQFLILNEPYNPGGIAMSGALQKEVIDICREHGITILCDEVYRLLEHGDDTRLPTMANAYERGISVVTMSKPWGGCGITIGWLACQDREMVQRLVDVQYFGTACVSRASEIQGRMVLRVSGIILRERRDIILSNKALLQVFIEDRYKEWFEWRRPNAGAIAFVKFKGPLTSVELGRKLADAGISIKPAYCFTDSVVGEVEDYFRVGFGEQKMPLALAALGEFVDAQEESWRAAMPGRYLVTVSESENHVENKAHRHNHCHNGIRHNYGVLLGTNNGLGISGSLRIGNNSTVGTINATAAIVEAGVPNNNNSYYPATVITTSPTKAHATIAPVSPESSNLRQKPKIKARRGSHRNGGIVVFIHMPKTGGDSMLISLENYTWIDYVFSIIDGPRSNPNVQIPLKAVEKAVADPALSIGQNKTVWAELHIGMPSIVKLRDRIGTWRSKAAAKGIPFFIFAMIRQPIPFAVSWYEYWCVFMPTTGVRPCGMWVDETEESLRATARTDPQASFFVNHFHVGTRQRPMDVPTREDLEGTWDGLLSSVEWVGRTEAYNDTLGVVEEVLGREGQLEWVHTHKYPAKLHANNLTDSTKDFIRERSGLDQELYDRVEASYRIEDLWEERKE